MNDNLFAPERAPIIPQGHGFLVKMSHFNALSVDQKHNPAGQPDPFEALSLAPSHDGELPAVEEEAEHVAALR